MMEWKEEDLRLVTLPARRSATSDLGAQMDYRSLGKAWSRSGKQHPMSISPTAPLSWGVLSTRSRRPFDKPRTSLVSCQWDIPNVGDRFSPRTEHWNSDRMGLYDFSLAGVPVLRGFYTVFPRLVHMRRRQPRSQSWRRPLR